MSVVRTGMLESSSEKILSHINKFYDVLSDLSITADIGLVSGLNSIMQDIVRLQMDFNAIQNIETVKLLIGAQLIEIQTEGNELVLKYQKINQTLLTLAIQNIRNIHLELHEHIKKLKMNQIALFHAAALQKSENDKQLGQSENESQLENEETKTKSNRTNMMNQSNLSAQLTQSGQRANQSFVPSKSQSSQSTSQIPPMMIRKMNGINQNQNRVIKPTKVEEFNIQRQRDGWENFKIGWSFITQDLEFLLYDCHSENQLELCQKAKVLNLREKLLKQSFDEFMRKWQVFERSEKEQFSVKLTLFSPSAEKEYRLRLKKKAEEVYLELDKIKEQEAYKSYSEDEIRELEQQLQKSSYKACNSLDELQNRYIKFLTCELTPTQLFISRLTLDQLNEKKIFTLNKNNSFYKKLMDEPDIRKNVEIDVVQIKSRQSKNNVSIDIQKIEKHQQSIEKGLEMLLNEEIQESRQLSVSSDQSYIQNKSSYQHQEYQEQKLNAGKNKNRAPQQQLSDLVTQKIHLEIRSFNQQSNESNQDQSQFIEQQDYEEVVYSQPSKSDQQENEDFQIPQNERGIKVKKQKNYDN